MWIYTKEALTGGQILDREQEEYPRKRIMSIMLCTNWVCAGTFVDREWVSSRTIIQQEEEISSMALDFKIDVPCVVQWSLLRFSAPTNLNRILVSDLEIQKVSRSRQWCHHGRYCETIQWSAHRSRACGLRWPESYNVHTKREELIKR